MKTAIAYVLLFILGCSGGARCSIVLVPVAVAISRWGHPFMRAAIFGVAQSFLTAWFGTILFQLFSLTASWVMLGVLGVGLLLNDLDRLFTR